MSDVFAEVDEEIRQDRWQALLKRYGAPVLAVVVLGVLAFAGWQWWTAHQRAQAEAAALAVSEARAQAQKATPAAAAAALAKAAAAYDGAWRTIAQLHQAAIEAEQGRSAEALALWDKIAADTSADALFRGLASLTAVLHQLDSGDPATLRTRLAPLTEETSPWRHSAREAAAVLALRTGDRAQARDLIRRVADDSTAPRDARERAAELLSAIGPVE